MKNFYFCFLFSIPFIATAQNDKKEKTDSASYYSAELGKLWRATIDSFHHSEAYLSAQAGYKRSLKKSKDYGAFVIFMDLFHSDYRQFNGMIAQDGFAPINDLGGRVGFGHSQKSGRAIVDMYFIVAGLNNRSEKDREKIKTTFSSLLHVDLGYDLLNKQWMSIYPYGGLSMRISTIEYEKSALLNPSYTSITNMLSDKNIVNLSSVRAGFQLGLGIDLTLAQSRDKASKTIFFIKGGTNRPFWKDRYRYNDIPAYNPGMRQGDWIITFGIKLAGKN